MASIFLWLERKKKKTSPGCKAAVENSKCALPFHSGKGRVRVCVCGCALKLRFNPKRLVVLCSSLAHVIHPSSSSSHPLALCGQWCDRSPRLTNGCGRDIQATDLPLKLTAVVLTGFNPDKLQLCVCACTLLSVCETDWCMQECVCVCVQPIQSLSSLSD